MIAKFLPNKVRVLVFDVDDTVTRGTLSIKVDTFKTLFNDRPDRLQEGRELYEFTGKGDRYNIIAHVIDEPQEGCHSNPKVQQWARLFEKAIMKTIRMNGIHQDDLMALSILKKKFNGPIYLLSATPQDSVVGNIEHFETVYPEIKGMFAGVQGNPMQGGKAGELTLVAEKYGVSADGVLMVGDGGSDYGGALDSGTQFVAIVPDGKVDKWPAAQFPKITAVAQLPDLLHI